MAFLSKLNSSGEIFTWRSVTRSIEDILQRIRDEASAIIYASAASAASDASARYSPRFREVVVRPVSKYRARVSVVNRYVNFFDIGRSKGQRRETTKGRNRGAVTPQRVMGDVARAHRQRMLQQLDALVERERTREI